MRPSRIVGAVTALAVAVILVVNLYNAAANPLTVARATSMSVTREITCEAYVVRTETRIAGDASLTVPERRDGDRVSAGSLVAVTYASGDPITLKTLADDKARLLSLESAEVMAQVSRDALAADTVAHLARAVSVRDWALAASLSLAAEGLTMSGSTDEAVAAETTRLRGEIASLSQRLSGAQNVRTERPGIVNYASDGFEHVTYAAVRGMLPSELRAQFASPSDKGALRLVSGTNWYLAVIVPTEEVAALRERGSVLVSVPRFGDTAYTCKFEYAGSEENGFSTVTLSCDTNMNDTFAAREVSIRIQLDVQTGYAVPKEAVRFDGDACYVYVALMRQARRVRVDLLREADSRTYIVAPYTYPVPKDADANTKLSIALEQRAYDEGDGTLLRDGAEIVLRANGLADGKVIR
jgi:hypothetical protein